VRPTEPRHRIVDLDYYWTINAKSPIIEITDNEESSNIKLIFSLVKFEDFPKYVDSALQVGEYLVYLCLQVSKFNQQVS